MKYKPGSAQSKRAAKKAAILIAARLLRLEFSGPTWKVDGIDMDDLRDALYELSESLEKRVRPKQTEEQ